MKCHWLDVLTTALVILPSAACAPVITGIGGHVTGVDGMPVKNAQIRIEGPDFRGKRTVFRTKTDKYGDYIYQGLPARGSFDITVEVDHKQVVRIRGVRTLFPFPSSPAKTVITTTTTTTTTNSISSSSTSVAVDHVPAYQGTNVTVISFDHYCPANEGVTAGKPCYR
jgi:hypothetical protein